jgi:hypothetical protein
MAMAMFNVTCASAIPFTFLPHFAFPSYNEGVDVPDNHFSPSSWLIDRVKFIPSACLDFLKDDKWMAMMSELFGMASQMCSLIGTDATKYVPFLSIISSPIYLYHAVKESYDRFKLVNSAYACKEFADLFFWLGRGIGSVGTAVTDVMKPFVGGITLLGLVNLHVLGFSLSFILPILFIVLSAIGGASTGWAASRSAKALHQFRQRKKELDNSMGALEGLLKSMTDPLDATPAGHLYTFNLYDSCFTDNVRQLLIQKRIEALLGFNQPVMQKAHRLLMKTLDLIFESKELSQALNDPTTSFCQKLDQLLVIYQEILKYPEIHEFVSEVDKLKASYKALTKLKDTLLKEGRALTQALEIEIRCKLAEHLLNVLAAALTLAASLLFLMYPNDKTICFAISLSSASVGFINGFFNKSLPSRLYTQTT